MNRGGVLTSFPKEFLGAWANVRTASEGSYATSLLNSNATNSKQPACHLRQGRRMRPKLGTEVLAWRRRLGLRPEHAPS